MNSLTSSLGLFNLGLVEMLVVGGVLVLFFGARRLPGLMRGLGEAIRNFRGELKEPPGGKSGE